MGIDTQAFKKLSVRVTNLAFTVTADTLRAQFSKCGKIEEFDMPVRPNGKNTGRAMITFESKASLDKALALKGTELEGRRLNVGLKNASGASKEEAGTPEPKQEKKAKRSLPAEEQEASTEPKIASKEEVGTPEPKPEKKA